MAILTLHLPEKATSSHDVAPEVTKIEQMITVSLYRNSRKTRKFYFLPGIAENAFQDVRA
jgi:hypothetical protein